MSANQNINSKSPRRLKFKRNNPETPPTLLLLNINLHTLTAYSSVLLYTLSTAFLEVGSNQKFFENLSWRTGRNAS